MTKNFEKNMNEGIVATIDYLQIKNGKTVVVDHTDYEDREEFAEDVKNELAYGVSIRVTYVDDNGDVVSKNLMNDHDCLPKMGRASGDFMKVFERSMDYLAKAYNITDEPVEVRL